MATDWPPSQLSPICLHKHTETTLIATVQSLDPARTLARSELEDMESWQDPLIGQCCGTKV